MKTTFKCLRSQVAAPSQCILEDTPPQPSILDNPISQCPDNAFDRSTEPNIKLFTEILRIAVEDYIETSTYTREVARYKTRAQLETFFTTDYFREILDNLNLDHDYFMKKLYEMYHLHKRQNTANTEDTTDKNSKN